MTEAFKAGDTIYQVLYANSNPTVLTGTVLYLEDERRTAVKFASDRSGKFNLHLHVGSRYFGDAPWFATVAEAVEHQLTKLDRAQREARNKLTDLCPPPVEPAPEPKPGAPKFRLKQVTVEAHRWLPGWAQTISDWGRNEVEFDADTQVFMVRTGTGHAVARSGDYIVCHPTSGFAVYSATEFETRYEPTA